ncbi:MAG: DUF2924 domain-containing protein [Phycisphaeraceae bacterium]|nr:DUF2924 domain-containing protein [Phycisphaeraceae bacterium]
MNLTNIEREIVRLRELSLPQLKAEYQAAWGEPTRSNNSIFLIKRIAWRKQAAERGGLSEMARKRAAELASDLELRIRPPREVHAAFGRTSGEADGATSTTSALPPPGTRLVRDYRGRRIEVEVLERGFVWDGREFPSLTAVAEAVTGSAWNGRLFFGLTKRKGEQ